ncbi:MAG: undecaprenyl-diphosphate phosphatase [Actinobacteria bacterium]|jgi:undecaprenyl-diphosphatase|nr:undecaprenyl-diphosphate phosphatase [Actinomycetota bacterium]
MFSGLLSIPHALLLGIVEGITEFLPVSSTGHLLVVGELIGFGTGKASVAADTYSIAIQFGAILAVLFLYRNRVWSLIRGIVGADEEGRLFLVRLVVAFLPAAIIGVVAGDAMKKALFGPIPVTIAWLVGGALLLRWKPKEGSLALRQMPIRAAFIIGCAQSLALWPGVSRSLVTLVAALAVGLSMSAAIEFSFLLGLVTLSAATALDLVKHGNELVNQFGLLSPILGLVCAFITAVIAVKWMVGYLETHSLRVFGWYRLAIGAVCIVLLATNVL